MIALFALVACSGPGVREGKSDSILFRPLVSVIRRHRERETHIDGPQCKFYPTCSHYAEQAIGRHSILGLLSTIDRIFFREFGGLIEEMYLPVSRNLSEKLRYYDPVEDDLPLLRSRRPSLLHEDFFR